MRRCSISLEFFTLDANCVDNWNQLRARYQWRNLSAPVSNLFAQSKAHRQGTVRCGYEKEAGVPQTALSQLHGQPLMEGRAVLQS